MVRFIQKQPLALLVPTFGFASIMVPSRSAGKLGAGYGNFFYRASMSDRKPWRLRDRALGPYMERRRPTPHAADRLLSFMAAPIIARFPAGSLGLARRIARVESLSDYVAALSSAGLGNRGQ